MKGVALLRGVIPVGQNRIPKMTCLAEILTEASLENIKTYIQSNNVVFETTLSDDDVYILIHDTIQARIGADSPVILKTQAQFTTALAGNPFNESYDNSRVHSVFTSDQLSQEVLNELSEADSGVEILKAGSECLYLYLPREAKEKQLNANYLEKQLHITTTT